MKIVDPLVETPCEFKYRFRHQKSPSASWGS